MKSYLQCLLTFTALVIGFVVGIFMLLFSNGYNGKD